MVAIEELAHRAAIDPRIRAEALDAAAGTLWLNQSAQAVALMRWVQSHVAYTLDPDGWDVYQDHTLTLATMRGDCAAQTVLLLGLLRSIGIEAWALYADHGAGIDHVLVRAYTNDRGALDLDPIAYWRLPGEPGDAMVYEFRPDR